MNIIHRLIKRICIKINYKKSKSIIHTEYMPINTKIGMYCQIGKNVKIGDNCSIGDFSYINQNSVIEENVQIGKFCSISENVRIAPIEHPMKYISTHPIFYDKNYQNKMNIDIHSNKHYKIEQNKETIIGNDVWIGMNTIIKKGITIGNGAVIGAGAVVTKNIEPYAIAVGVPATIKKYRFEEEKIRQLEKEQWWSKGLEYIKQNYDKIMNNSNI